MVTGRGTLLIVNKTLAEQPFADENIILKFLNQLKIDAQMHGSMCFR